MMTTDNAYKNLNVKQTREKVVADVKQLSDVTSGQCENCGIVTELCGFRFILNMCKECMLDLCETGEEKQSIELLFKARESCQ